MGFISRRVILEKFKIKKPGHIGKKSKNKISQIVIPDVTFSHAVTKRLNIFFLSRVVLGPIPFRLCTGICYSSELSGFLNDFSV